MYFKTNILLFELGSFSVSQDEDYDYLAKLSKLVNAIGTQLILCWQRYVFSWRTSFFCLYF